MDIPLLGAALAGREVLRPGAAHDEQKKLIFHLLHMLNRVSF